MWNQDEQRWFFWCHPPPSGRRQRLVEWRLHLQYGCCVYCTIGIVISVEKNRCRKTHLERPRFLPLIGLLMLKREHKEIVSARMLMVAVICIVAVTLCSSVYFILFYLRRGFDANDIYTSIKSLFMESSRQKNSEIGRKFCPNYLNKTLRSSKTRRAP